MPGIASEERANSSATFFYVVLSMDAPVLVDQLGFTYISSAQTLDAV